jgi:2-polyprenylphenol 6-hydroxylase
MADDYDVVVAGGGLVGATAALALARCGRSVALIDRQRPVVRRGALGFDVRTVALNLASERLLAELGVWHRLDVCRYRRVVVWEETGSAMLEFLAEDAAVKDLGAIAEAGPATHVIWQAADDEPRLTSIRGELTAVEPAAAGPAPRGRSRTPGGGAGSAVKIALGDRRLSARLLIAADGAESTVRRLLGVPAEIRATPHMAIATVVEMAGTHEATAWQRFLHDGPLALLPLPGRSQHVCSVVWSQSRAEAERRMQLDDAAFRSELQMASEGRLGSVREVDRRASFVLRQQLSADFFPAPGVILVGDAARVLHPLAGQGVNAGLEDVRELVAIAAAVEASDLPRPDVWRGFARRRRLRSRLMLRAMDAFRQAYAIEDPVLQWLRNVGVRRLDAMPPLKRTLIMEALGIGPFSLGAPG